MAASGEEIDVWHQPWIPWLDFNCFNSLMESIKPKGYTVRTLADLSIGNEWNKEVVQQIFGDLGNRITEIPRLPLNHKDKIIWTGKQNGIFSIKSAYGTDQEAHFDQKKKGIWTWIGHSDLHPRLSTFLWRVLNEALPVREKLRFLLDKDCPLCNSAEENCLHLFKNCGFAKMLWFSGKIPLLVDKIPGENVIQFTENMVTSLENSNYDRKEILTYMGCVWEQIWRSRNDLCRRGIRANLDMMKRNIEMAFQSYSTYSGKDALVDIFSDPPKNRLEEAYWQRILDGKRVICTDASWLRGEARLAAVMRMKNLESWAHKTSRTKAESALIAELKAILLALQWAWEKKWDRICVLSDCAQTIQALRAKQCPPFWKTFNVALEILDCSK
ncbi:hypothetical protein CsatB_026962 [Cannabis sativa]